MKLLWLALQFVLSRKTCPHFSSLYCCCAAERREELARKIKKYVRAETPVHTVRALERAWDRSTSRKTS